MTPDHVKREWQHVMDADYYVEHGRWPPRRVVADVLVGMVLAVATMYALFTPRRRA
jgi:hypothetical protein